MKIVINAFSARMGGGKTYLANLLSNLPDDPHLSIDLFASSSFGAEADARVRRVATRWPMANPLLRALWERFALPAYLRRVNADILFCPGGVVGTHAPAGCKTVTMFRNMLPFDIEARRRLPFGLQRLRNWLLNRVLLESMSRADLTIFISEFGRKLIESRTKINKAVTITHGIAANFRVYDRALPSPAGAGKYLLYVSRFDVYKHQYEVVQAFASLPPSLNAHLQLFFVGETGGAEATRVMSLVEELGMGDRIKALGAIAYTELPSYYRNAEAIIFASSCENCPNILLEALGAGRPVLSSNVPPMPEFGGPNIIYFSPLDPEDLATELSKVLSDSNYAQQVATASAERSLRYDWERTARDTWAEISDLARSR